MIYIVGDLHVRKEAPFFSATNKVLSLLETEMFFNPKSTFIQLGDFFHSAKPYPKEYSLALQKIEKLSVLGKVYIMAGNNAHEYHYLQKTYAIDPLIKENVHLIQTPEVIAIENKIFLFLPWIPQEAVKALGASSMEELYSDIGQYISLPEKVDYVLYHFEDETVFLGGENHGIDLSYLEKLYPSIRRVGGHIHLQTPNYLGSPYQTRYDEKGQVGRYLAIDEDKEEYKVLPPFIRHLDIDYSDEPQSSDISDYILTISNAPSVDSAYRKFSQEKVFIRDVKLKFKENREETQDQENSNSSIKEYLFDYLKTNKVDKETSKYLLNLF